MKRTSIAALALLLASTAGFSGCAYKTPIIPPQGILFSSVKYPLTVNYDGQPVMTRDGIRGKSATQNFTDWLFTGLNVSWDESSIKQIAADNGIEHVYYADVEVTNVLLFYKKLEVTVYGE